MLLQAEGQGTGCGWEAVRTAFAGGRCKVAAVSWAHPKNILYHIILSLKDFQMCETMEGNEETFHLIYMISFQEVYLQNLILNATM